MELSDLNHEESVALAGLIEFVVMASGHVTEDEQREIDDIVDALGESAYQSAVEEVDARFGDEAALREFLSTITRQEARELIYGVVLNAAMADSVDGRPSALLDWLAETWQVEVRIEDPVLEAEIKPQG